MQTEIEVEIPISKYRSNILSTIGKTSLVSLARLSEQMEFSVFGKMESCNSGGSIKDRTALNMLSQAMETGRVKSDDTIIESSSGNMALYLS